MYNNYYSASDAQIYLSSPDHTRLIKLDTVVSIAYNLTQSSIPIYSLGYRKPQFFSSGNTLGQGVLSLAFTDEEALKYALNYIMEAETGKKYTSLQYGKKMSNNDFISLTSSVASTDSDKRLISIGAIQSLFNIKIQLNNESAIRGSDTKVISLVGVKVTGESLPISSYTDSTLTINYNFIFKDIERG